MPPLMGSIGADSAKAYGFTSVIIAPTYYMAYYGTTNGTNLYYACNDSDGAIYGAGYNATASRPYFWKVSSTGAALSWQKTYDVAATRGVSTLYDGSNIWLGTTAGVFKVNPSTGDMIFAGRANSITFVYKMVLSGTSLFLFGNFTGVGYGGVAKMDVSSGLSTALFQYSYATSAPSSTQSGFYSGGIDSSGNIICVGFTGTSGVVMKLPPNSSTATWTRNHTISGQTNFQYNNVAIDSSDNMYVVGVSVRTASGSDAMLTKLNSSGTVQWSKSLKNSTTVNDSFQDVTLDPSQNYLYAVGSTASNSVLIAKFDLSGNLIFQRTLDFLAGSSGWSIQVDSNSMYIGARAARSGLSQNFTAKLPNDGSKTGTYSLGGTNVVYASSSLTLADETLTVSTSAFAAIGSASGATAITTSWTSLAYTVFQNTTIP